MKKSNYIAPVIIAILLILYFGFIAAIFFIVPIALWVKALLLIVPLALIGVVIFILRERIKELRSGELDDISKY